MRPDMRTVGLNVCIGLFYWLGSMVLPWVALQSGEWRHFLLYVSAPFLLVIPYYWLLPESARWLIDKGRVNEAVRCFKRIAAFNGRGQLPSSAVDVFTVSRLPYSNIRAIRWGEMKLTRHLARMEINLYAVLVRNLEETCADVGIIQGHRRRWTGFETAIT